MLITDSRVRTMNEILNSIKLIKMYAWEDSFEKKIAGMMLAVFFLSSSYLSLFLILSYPILSYLYLYGNLAMVETGNGDATIV